MYYRNLKKITPSNEICSTMLHIWTDSNAEGNDSSNFEMLAEPVFKCLQRQKLRYRLEIREVAITGKFVY